MKNLVIRADLRKFLNIMRQVFWTQIYKSHYLAVLLEKSKFFVHSFTAAGGGRGKEYYKLIWPTTKWFLL
ncbi:MAG: hypothetical protein LBR79_05080 [Oscillospiraceae bacterium]|nr:hypothetical protein [Oscillospiraceae bacterium]